ncbi:unnamed protein product [Arabis nemorensis]|uniref:No apical meristem-associated C-terminal domain-containing protein n=1 Tax=Arabis nemorensis TaxID=586526 RepID=A0A565C406_9BRAS|nr:unnamed protein product [Arabis nemorensis]
MSFYNALRCFLTLDIVADKFRVVALAAGFNVILLADQEKKKPPGTSSTSTTACHVGEETEERPLGVKASKGKGKKRVRGQSEDAGESSLKVLQEMWVIKKEDLAGQHKILSQQKILSEQKILDSLILKPEPLSEADVILKNKLTTEMCNLLG